MNILTPMGNTRGFQPLELVVSIAIISIITTMAIHQYMSARFKAFSLKAMTELHHTRDGMILWYQVKGYWPESMKNSLWEYDTGLAHGSNQAHYRIHYAGDGSFHIYYGNQMDQQEGQILSYRFAPSTISGSSNLLWLCGNRDERLYPYNKTLQANLTTLPLNHLTLYCR